MHLRRLVSLLFLVSPLGWAGEFCVDTSAELQAALVAAAANGADDDLRIVQGSYLVDPAVFPASEPFALTLSGGWNPQCTAATRDVRLTVLESTQADTAILVFKSGTRNSVIRNLTLLKGFLRFDRSASVTMTGISILAADRDGDGVDDAEDAFPDDPTEQLDTDGDGIGNNEDTDDDNDQMPDVYERRFGLDPLADDGGDDADGDGYTNFDEFEWGTAPNDAGDTPSGVPAWLLLLPAIQDR